jgi:uncharacterized iron-regulated membrane protein
VEILSRRAMKKRLWQIHSLLGLAAGLGLLVIGVTGSALVFRGELDALFAARETRVEPTAQGRLSWDALLRSAQIAWPAHEVTGFGPRSDPRLADLVYMKPRGGHEFVAGTLDPYTGAALSGPVQPGRTFTGLLLELHYTWFAEHIGMLVTGIFAVVLCLLGLTGLWLYRDFWRSFFLLRWEKSGRIFFSDLHKTIGISTVAFNLLLGFTGAYWNLTHVAADGLGHHDAAADRMPGRLYSDALSLDALAAAAAEQMPGFQVKWVSLPAKAGEDAVTLWGRVPTGNPLSSDYGSMAAFDARTGALRAAADARQAGLWTRFTDTFRALHFGSFGGLPIKVLWCLGGLAPGALAVSGVAILRLRHRRQTQVAGAPLTRENSNPVLT